MALSSSPCWCSSWLRLSGSISTATNMCGGVTSSPCSGHAQWAIRTWLRMAGRSTPAILSFPCFGCDVRQMTLSLTFAIIGLLATFAVAMREHVKVMASRRNLLDRCAALLSNTVIKHGGDGFPMLEGFRGRRFIRVELVPDTMTIRRLPQLWLKLTRIEVRHGLSEFSVLVRPSGTE